MRILQVIHSLDPRAGGTTEGLKQLSAALVRQGVEVEAMCLDAPEAPWVGDFPVKLHALGPGRTGYGYAERAGPWLEAHAGDYDLVVVNGLWQYSGFAVWRAARKTGLRYAVFTHGMLDPWFKRQYPLKHLKKWLYWPWGEYRVLRDAGAVFFTSEAERMEASESFWLYRSRERVVGFGIEPPPVADLAQEETFFGAYPDLQGKRLLLFLGRIHLKKGCDLLLRAYAEVTAAMGEAEREKLHLVMAGPHDNAYGEEMVRLTGELGLAGRVTWTGMLKGAKKWGALWASEAFVLPSHQENFGVSVVEAMACGRAVLISDKVNIWREVKEDEAGFVESDDQEGTRRLLERWLGLDEADRIKMGEQAWGSYMKRFRMDGVAERLVAEMDVLIRPKTQDKS